MCGIVAFVGQQPAAPILLTGLRRLEYRGYDSAGIATLSEGRIERRRAQGKVDQLAKRLSSNPLPGAIGVAHTRWATHGLPVERNAHPIATKAVAVVHNGIIENHRELRFELERDGQAFHTETDTEVAAVLLTRYLAEGMAPLEAVDRMLKGLEGTFALAILFAGREDFLICTRRGSPLAVGYGEREMFAGSDALALAPMTRNITYLEDGDRAVLTRNGVDIYSERMRRITRAIATTTIDGAAVEKGNHAHFMRKEIFEQPDVIRTTFLSLLNGQKRSIRLPKMPFPLSAVQRLVIVACGTSYHAGLVARYWIDAIAHVPVEVEVASEFRYRAPRLGPGTLVLGISQSGETADTLAALRYAKSCGADTIAVVNQAESSMAREVGCILQTLAGPEIGVASTKAFTTQLVVLAAFAIALGRAKRSIGRKEEQTLVAALAEIADRVCEALGCDEHTASVAHRLSAARDVLYVGRGTAYPIALEAALKLKEISYVHAEGYPAGELKHGPIALIDGQVPVVVLAPPGELFSKTASNMAEVMARGGQVILISDRDGIAEAGEVTASIELPTCDSFTTPILYSVAVQLLAYHAGLDRGADVDKPRNLAKSVTVE
jgi:glucosamine--fructose-6-phosphate aminotransferase (isomerizing)